MAIDKGRGRFPVTLYKHDKFILDPEAPDGYRIGSGNPLFDFDNQGMLNNMIFAERNEDKNGNGRLDFGEDSSIRMAFLMSRTSLTQRLK